MFNKKLLASTALLLASGLMSACTSGSTSNSSNADNFQGTAFNGSDDSTGSIRLALEDGDELAVSQVESFRVKVRDGSGGPVVNTPIFCDTEDGLALIEPASGQENTDSNGQMSGRVGCQIQGSFLLACRLGEGANKRKAVTVKCTGDVPTGFDGFPPPVGGGGLGGGVSDGNEGGPGGAFGSVRITNVRAFDSGSQDDSGASSSIDTLQGTCGTGTDITAEPFFDTSLGVTVVNNSNTAIQFTSMKFKVSNADGLGSSYTSPSMGLIGESTALDAMGGTQTFYVLAFDAVSDSFAGESNKRFAGANSAMPTALGFRNVAVTLTGTNGFGETVSVKGTVALSFDNFNKCTS